MKLLKPDEKGVSLKDHLENAFAQSGVRHPALTPPPLSFHLQRAWSWFWELSNRRGSSGFGPCALTFQDFIAWESFTGRRPSHLEKKAMLAFDAVFLRVMLEK